MNQLALVLFLVGLPAQSTSASGPTQHQCFRAARAIALNVIKRNSNHKDLAKAELFLSECSIDSQKLQCLAGKSPIYLEFEPSLEVERLSPTREDLDFAFWTDIKGTDIGVEISMTSTPNHPCKYNVANFFVEPNGKE